MAGGRAWLDAADEGFTGYYQLLESRLILQELAEEFPSSHQ
jgi:hypothetical protein